MAQPTQQEIDEVVAAYEKSVAVSEYNDRLLLEMQQNSGTDYTMVWTA